MPYFRDIDAFSFRCHDTLLPLRYAFSRFRRYAMLI